MPELPDIKVYVDALSARIRGRVLERISVRSPFLVRTFDPPLDAAQGKTVVDLSRIGKRIVLSLDGDLHLVLHLMIAGRLRWADNGSPPVKAGKIEQAVFRFDSGTLTLTEASPKKRASLHLVRGWADLRAHDPGGIEPLEADLAAFAAAVRRENRTLKRFLTDPRLIAGIGNAYSDEILHAAGLSPVRLTSALSIEETGRLHAAVQATLVKWTERLRRDFGLDGGEPGRFPGAGEITAFRPDFAVHGRFGKPCPVCGSPVQRIMHAENETNYCARCQTGGKLLADRSLSRLLRDDWPKSIDELEGA